MIIKAEQITVGVQLSESDGFLWDVTEIISTTAKSITVRLNSDHSSFKVHWKGQPGIIKSFRKSTRLDAIVPADHRIDGIMQDALRRFDLRTDGYNLYPNQLDGVLSVAISQHIDQNSVLNWLTYKNIPDTTRSYIKRVFNID